MEYCAIHDIPMDLVYDGVRVKRWKCPTCGSTVSVKVSTPTEADR